MIRFFILVCLIFCFAATNHRIDAKNCVKRYYRGTWGQNSFVCVCNSSACDEIESVDENDKQTMYQEFVTSRDQYRLDKFKSKFSNQPSASSWLYIRFSLTHNSVLLNNLTFFLNQNKTQNLRQDKI